MAEILKACRFYVGNMSLQYIISEALKVPRLLEASPDFPVAFPVGPNAFDAYHQNHFEKFFKVLNNSIFGILESPFALSLNLIGICFISFPFRCNK